MRLFSPAWANGEPLPPAHTLPAAWLQGALPPADAPGNVSPPLAWADLPAGTRSLVLVAQDFDAPDPARVPPDAPLAASAPRADFFLWLMADLPASLSGLPAGASGQGFVPGGRPEAPAAPGLAGVRQGLNDYTRLLAADPARAGRYHGYDGPHCRADDPLVHHCLFTLYALALPRLPLAGAFTGQHLLQLLPQLDGQVLGAATLSGTVGPGVAAAPA